VVKPDFDLFLQTVEVIPQAVVAHALGVPTCIVPRNVSRSGRSPAGVGPAAEVLTETCAATSSSSASPKTTRRDGCTPQSETARRFLSDGYGPAVMIWADQQRAIGELMIVEQYGKLLCMGYATFATAATTRSHPGAKPCGTSLRRNRAPPRLRDIQHLLCELVETLDMRRVRYTQDLDRA
jgi:hypothetical protein